MPRTARSIADHEIYHVLNRGNGGAGVFHTERDYVEFVRLLEDAKSSFPVQLLGYCIMPNHFHLILRPEAADALGYFMHWLMTTHVRRHHVRRNTAGHVWQGRYKSFRIDGDAHFLMVLRYVERNPVRAGLAHSARAWRWSSHRERLGLERTTLVDPVPMDLPTPWGTYVDEPLHGGELRKIRRSIQRQTPY